jgi:uncharacterized membrane protein YhfC
MSDSLVVLAFILAAAFETCLPLAAGWWLNRKLLARWKVFACGVVFFLAVQVPHMPLVIYSQQSASLFFKGALGDGALSLAAMSLFLGLLAGLFEETGRFLAFRYFFPLQKIAMRRENAAMFGVGWGGVESIAVGVLLVLTLLAYVSVQPATPEYINSLNESTGGELTGAQADRIEAQIGALLGLTPLDLLASPLERAMAMTLHVAFTLMVFGAVVYSKKWMLGLAIAWHALMDAGAVFAASSFGVFASEAFVFVLAIAAAWYIRFEWERLGRVAAA